MAVRDIAFYGDSILRKKCREVSPDEDLSDLIVDMLDSMYEAEGIGLAANQIGVNKNLFVIDISHVDENESPRIFINGKVEESEGESVYSEGCLSLPEIKFDVTRPEKISFSFYDEEHKKHVEDFDGLLARAIQHEVDHLNGILIIDRVSTAAKIPFQKNIRNIKNTAIKGSHLKSKPEVYL
jgi:peptide deformylase|tara:strand:- start:998 stop:1543 length:546 start_codon:yes stop_codon:yes gene_type:complete